MEKKPFTPMIKTERLILKRHETTFAYAQRVYDSIKENWNFLQVWMDKMWGITKPEDEYNFFQLSQKWFDDMSEAGYAMFDKEGLFLGTIAAFGIDYADACLEIGYWLEERACGKGYIREAVKALEDEFFNRGVHRIQILMDTENVRSENVPIKLGYRLDGVLRENTYSPYFKTRRSTKIYSKLKSEWEAK